MLEKQPHWISLSDYATKYNISVSTLRRRIKLETIQVKADNGRYFLPDRPLFQLELVQEASQRPQPQTKEIQVAIAQVEKNEAKLSEENTDFSTAKLLLSEVKKAYMAVLQEKEEQLLTLKSEVVDLNTLVRALEKENSRLSNIIRQISDRGL